ncbi:hypothetical protein FXO38_35141 [Capsicum annuum]|nr:hypothetical protein FXO38_35141 [Capsicum annuum]
MLQLLLAIDGIRLKDVLSHEFIEVFQGHKPSIGRSQLICTGGILMVTVQYSNDYKDDKNEALHTQYIFRTDVPHGGPAFHAAGTDPQLPLSESQAALP